MLAIADLVLALMWVTGGILWMTGGVHHNRVGCFTVLLITVVSCGLY